MNSNHSCLSNGFMHVFHFYFLLFFQMRIDDQLKVEHVEIQWNEIELRASKQNKIVIYLNVHFRTSLSDPFSLHFFIIHSFTHRQVPSSLRRQSFVICDVLALRSLHNGEYSHPIWLNKYYYIFHLAPICFVPSLLISILNWKVRNAHCHNDQRTKL